MTTTVTVKEAYLKPGRAGLQVRQTDGRVLPTEGKRVALTPYWRRRIADGDVVVGSAPAKRKAAARPQTKSED
ncbi:MAG: DUF2635 domain-containing protein [Aquisalimonadaceae bacterium]